MTFSFLSLGTWRKTVGAVVLALGMFAAFSSSLAWADGTNAAPVVPTGQDKISQYLVDHQEDLGPFFDQHQDALVKEAVPVLISLIGSLLLLNLAIGWAVDVGLGYGYSFFFAPLYAKIRRALIYASGRLVLSLVISILSALAIFSVSGISPILVVVVAVLMGLLNLVAQIVLVTLMYRTRLLMTVLFYVAIVLTHAVLVSLVTFPIMKGRINANITQFIDQNVTSQLRLAAADTHHELDTAKAARDKTKAAVTEALNNVDQANHDESNLKQEIEQQKNSEAYVYSRLSRLHAQGDLNGAHAALTDFLAKFPNGALKSAAQAQLTQVESELATQAAQQKQAAADAATAAAAARADLLARAAKGQVTLTEMRHALIGKSRADVVGLFGQPTETASDRWGYRQKMVLDPLTQKTYGLTVNFFEGNVQGVDYYYGTDQ